MSTLPAKTCATRPIEHAAMARGTPLHHRLMVGAGDEPRAQPTRIDLLQLQFRLGRDAQGQTGPRFIHGLAIGGGGQRDIIGVLVAALDLERGDADLHDLGHLVQRVEVARREQVARVAQRLQAVVHDQLVGQAAGLRALAAVGAAPAPRLRREALAGVGDAERAVHEHLQLASRSGCGWRDVVERQLAGQHHAAHAELLRQVDALGAGDAHLRAAVDLEIGRDLPGKLRDGQVLHDDGVGAGFGDGAQEPGGFGQLMVEDQRVEGDIALDAAAVQRAQRVGQFGQGEADLGAGGEVLEAEVDGVGAGLDGGVQLRPVAGGAHDFGFTAVVCFWHNAYVTMRTKPVTEGIQ